MKPNQHPLHQLTPDQAKMAKRKVLNIVNALNVPHGAKTVTIHMGKAVELSKTLGLDSLAQEIGNYKLDYDATVAHRTVQVRDRMESLQWELERLYPTEDA